MTPRAIDEFTNSMLFALASLLTGIMSALSLVFIAANEKTQQPAFSRNPNAAFLADKHRALNFYRVFSAAYDILNPHLYTSKMRNEIVSRIGDSRSLCVLDVGCGTGYTTQGILERENVYEVVGIDMNPVQLCRAAKNLNSAKSRATLERADAENLPFGDRVFDAVVSVGAIEYFPDPEKALKEMARVAKSGAPVVVGGPDYAWFSKFGLNRFFYTPSAGEVKVFFQKAGLVNLESVLTGVDTFFGTECYVAVVSGKKLIDSYARNST